MKSMNCWLKTHPYKTPLEIDKELHKYYRKSKMYGQWLFKFKNNYGASVVKHYGSYGFENDKFELAVIYWDDKDFNLTYNTPITDDVIGYLTNEQVMEYLYKIKELEG